MFTGECTYPFLGNNSDNSNNNINNSSSNKAKPIVTINKGREDDTISLPLMTASVTNVLNLKLLKYSL